MLDLRQGDCLEVLRDIPDHSVDLVLTDPPYGTTANQWDTPLDLAAIWPQLRRVGRTTTPVLLFTQLPFLIDVAISNRAELKYAWVCEKGNATGFLNANRAPMKAYEQVLVFYRAWPKYNPQMEKGDPYIRHRKGEKSSNYHGYFDNTYTVSDGSRYPRDIISKDKWSWAGETLVHPTQKPVRLLEYLICTYTDPGDTVLDFTMGSGSTGVACVRTGRNFIGIERDADYFATAEKRIAEAVEIKELEDAQTTIGGMQMSKRKKSGNAVRDKPERRSSVGFVLGSGWDSLCCTGYTRLADNPEVRMAVGRIADLISSMSIRLMENTDSGDVRVRNELSRRLDINPNPWMTRKTLVAYIVWILLLSGGGNAVVWPQTKDGMLEALIPVPPEQVSFERNGWGYRIRIGGVAYDPAELLHFVVNPSTSQPWLGTGYRVALQAVVKNLRQAAETKNAFLSSEWKPSVIVKVDGNSEELTTVAGRKRLTDQYLKTSSAGEPWMIPAEQMEVVQVKPLSLNDLAISDSVKLDKQSVAAILGVPPYVVGVGSFNQSEWNHFVATTIMPIVRGIEQELTRKLLISPRWYVAMNPWALYAYELKDLASIGADLYIRGAMTGNELRNWLNLAPKEGLDELVILENFIPQSMIGDQKKLKGNGGGSGDGTE